MNEETPNFGGAAITLAPTLYELPEPTVTGTSRCMESAIFDRNITDDEQRDLHVLGIDEALRRRPALAASLIKRG